MKIHSEAQARALHAIAIAEAAKGILVLAASVGLLSLLHHDIRHIAHEVVRHAGVNPAAHYPMILLHYADILGNANLHYVMLLAVGYALVRLVEAYGLWQDRSWGEWLGALSGAIYIPFEINHFIHRPSLTGAVVFVINVLIVGFLAFRLYRRRSIRLNLQSQTH
jgi:uncharacterized membrane protein (DUF2068 family)